MTNLLLMMTNRGLVVVVCTVHTSFENRCLLLFVSLCALETPCVSCAFLCCERTVKEHEHTMDGVTVKFVAEQGGQATGDIRRVKMDWPVSYEMLALVAARLFGAPAVKFRYVDDEGDRIVVSSQYELDCALFLRGGAGAPLRLHTELFQANTDIADTAIDYTGATILSADQLLSPCSNVSDDESEDESSDESESDDDDDDDECNPAVALFKELVRGSQDAQTTVHNMQSMGRFLRVLGEALVVGSRDVHHILSSRVGPQENVPSAVLPPPPPPTAVVCSRVRGPGCVARDGHGGVPSS